MYEGEAMEKMGNLMYEVGSWVATKYGIEKVLELSDPDTFRAMMNEYHEAFAQAIKNPAFRKEAALRTYKALRV